MLKCDNLQPLNHQCIYFFVCIDDLYIDYFFYRLDQESDT